MSHDLLAAFTDLPAPNAVPSSDSPDDDEWGDFVVANADRPTEHREIDQVVGLGSPEWQAPKVATSSSSAADASRQPKRSPNVGKHPFAGNMDLLFEADDEYDAGADDLENLATNPEAAAAYSKRIIGTQHGIPTAAAESLQQRGRHSMPRNPNILFDAEDLSDSQSEDHDKPFKATDEAVLPAASAMTGARSGASELAPSLLDPGKSVLSTDQATGTNDLGTQKLDRAVTTLGKDTSTFASNSFSYIEQDSWGEFETDHANVTHVAEDGSSAASHGTETKKNGGCDDFNEAQSPLPSRPQDALFHAATNQASHVAAVAACDTLPPTNIPPPSVLLSVFPSLFSSAQEDLFAPLSRLSSAQKHQLLEHQAAQTIIRHQLNHAIVLSHIIAGRKLRWRRDQILSQSMRMGPASASAKGMKLAGIDKSEAAKEDREVLDALKIWKAQVGKLRGAIACCPPSLRLPQVPEISENMPVKVLKAEEGGLVAPRACVLCGLKREERVIKAQVGIDDSFDEWWLNGMHTFCKTWWEANKRKLQSR